MRSMSGFGSGSARRGDAHVTVELRTVNHKYLDVRVTAPPGAIRAAAVVERRIRERLGRGRAEAAVTVESDRWAAWRRDAVVSAFRCLEEVRKEIGVDAPIDLGAVYASVAGERAAEALPPAEVEAAAREAIDAALREVEAMRGHEGAALRELLLAGIGEMERLAGRLAEEAGMLRASLPDRVRARLSTALQAAGAGTVEECRLAYEIALAVDRMDVAEEVDRLRCHTAHLGRVLNEDGAVGRRADFLVQEVLREANTLSAKAQDVSISSNVVDIRALAERLKIGRAHV